jgi:hypothetical protein
MVQWQQLAESIQAERIDLSALCFCVMRTETDYAYLRDVILILKRVVKMMPEDMPKEEHWEFVMQVLLADAQIQKLKRDLNLDIR